ncbi:uncharacterized protein LOC135471389 [Liolophura sinensis]|uniref:uncharacterized protein LOC135471389 n=1 Tax=Liolophura sinensis TaxID=3198878 RepID=UPI003157FF95
MAEGSLRSSIQTKSSVGQDSSSLSSSSSAQIFEFTWAEETYRLSDLTGQDQFPRVVNLEPDEGVEISYGLRPYLNQPVILNQCVSKRDVSARTVYRDKTTGKYFEVGQTLLIPDSYEGWFEIVPPSFGRAEFYSSIEQVAKAMPRKFFTRNSVGGIIVTKTKTGETVYKERKVPAGVILKTDGLFTAQWKTETQSGLFKRKEKQYVTREIQYLRCYTPDRLEILIPFEHSGKFNAVYDRDKTTETSHSIYRMKDLIESCTFPMMVRLIYGKAPVVPCIFTGLLAIKDCQKRDTVIGSTIVNKRNVLFELPVDTFCNVQLSSNDEQFSTLTGFRDARKLCKKYAVSFASMIKLSPDMDTDKELKEYTPKKTSQSDNLQSLDLIKDMNIADSPREEMFEADGSGEVEEDSGTDGDKVLELAKDGEKKEETMC